MSKKIDAAIVAGFTLLAKVLGSFALPEGWGWDVFSKGDETDGYTFESKATAGKAKPFTIAGVIFIPVPMTEKAALAYLKEDATRKVWNEKGEEIEVKGIVAKAVAKAHHEVESRRNLLARLNGQGKQVTLEYAQQAMLGKVKEDGTIEGPKVITVEKKLSEMSAEDWMAAALKAGFVVNEKK